MRDLFCIGKICGGIMYLCFKSPDGKIYVRKEKLVHPFLSSDSDSNISNKTKIA